MICRMSVTNQVGMRNQAHHGDLPHQDVRDGDGDEKFHRHGTAMSVPIIDRPALPYFIVTGSQQSDERLASRL